MQYPAVAIKVAAELVSNELKLETTTDSATVGGVNRERKLILHSYKHLSLREVDGEIYRMESSKLLSAVLLLFAVVQVHGMPYTGKSEPLFFAAAAMHMHIGMLF